MPKDHQRKRQIRALMAETGLKYMQAAGQVDEQWARSQRGEPVEIVFVGALANPTIEVVYERSGDEWQASSPQISCMDERDPSFDVLDSRVRARMAEWARPEVKVTYTTRSEGARDA